MQPTVHKVSSTLMSFTNYDVQTNNDQIILSISNPDPDWELEGYVRQVTLSVTDDLAQSNATIFYNLWNTKDVNMSADWTYADRYMKSYEGKGGLNNLEYTFDAGNLVDVSGTSFEYDQTQKYTRPGMDIAALFLQLSNINYTQDWGWMYAAFTGLIGEKSAGIPVKMSVVDPETEETTTHELNYTYDEDNYVTSVSYESSYYGMGMVTFRIDFTYEEVQ